MDSVPQKRCTKCKEYSPSTAEYFGHNKANKDKLNSWCRECARAWNRAHKIPSEKKKEYNTKYYKDHRAEIIAKTSSYASTNKEKVNAQRRNYLNKNPDKRKQYNANYRKKHPEHLRNKDKKRRARRRSLPATFTINDWFRSLDYFRGVCAYCGNSPSLFDVNKVLHQDHFVPVVDGGAYTPDNIVPACQSCNFSKHAKPAEKWLVDHFGKRRAVKILSRIRTYFEWIKTQE